MEAAAGGMSGGKHNHEDLSDKMALVEREGSSLPSAISLPI